MKNTTRVTALEISKKISSSAIFETIVREDRDVSDWHEENLHEWASSQLAGYLGEHVSPRSNGLRDYVEAGLQALDQIAVDVEIRIEELSESKKIHEVSSSTTSLKKNWLKAFELASEKVKREEVAILLAEDWLQANQVS